MCCNLLLVLCLFANMGYQSLMLYNYDNSLENWQISAISQNFILLTLTVINCQSFLKYLFCNTQRVILMKDDRDLV